MIRLIHWSAEHEWELKLFELHDTPQYQALSYTWGTDSNQIDLSIQDRTFKISVNLAAFLFSSRGKAGWWWIDQICIAQGIAAERSAQVLIMSEIYMQAKNVVIWLDNITEENSRNLVTLLAIAVAKEKKFRESEGVAGAPYPIPAIRPRTDAWPVMHFGITDVLKEVFDHPYWSRIWIIQEVMYAKKLQIAFGSSIVTLEDFRTLLDNLPQNLNWEKINVHAPWLIDHATSIGNRSSSTLYRLDEIVEDLSTGGCRDPRDFIYGIQGILQPAHRVQIDYKKSVEDVFLDAIEVLVTQWPTLPARWPPEPPQSLSPPRFESFTTRNLLRACFSLGELMIPSQMLWFHMIGCPQAMACFTNVIRSSETQLHGSSERELHCTTADRRQIIEGFRSVCQYRRSKDRVPLDQLVPTDLHSNDLTSDKSCVGHFESLASTASATYGQTISFVGFWTASCVMVFLPLVVSIMR
jgi:hypothetical protein